MMRIWMIGCWLATVLPLVFLLFWTGPVIRRQWAAWSRPLRWGLPAIWLLLAAFLLGRPHDDSFSGLDNMTYRQLSHVFLEGRGFHDPDAVLAGVPESLREDFLLHRGPVGRPTRDRIYELEDWTSVDVQPFFMPTLPLAAAAPSPLMAPERFVPLVASLSLLLILAAGCCAGGGAGLIAALALLAGTAWPAWFLRGFYAEAVGGLLIASVVAAVSMRPLRGWSILPAGFLLGLAVTYHPTLLVLAVPVALGLMLEPGRIRDILTTGFGVLLGLLPFWAMTRWVCQPYGDWTRLKEWREIILLSPEHRAIAGVLLVLAILSLVVLVAGTRPRIRASLRRWDGLFCPWGWLVLLILPLAGLALCPGTVGETLRTGGIAVWSGIRIPFGLLLGFGAWLVLHRDRPVRERFWLAALVCGSLLYLFIKGLETPVGLWSQRRFVPVILMGIALLVPPLAVWLKSLPAVKWRVGAVVLLVMAAAANPVRWPAAYTVINEEGASQWVQSMADEMGPDRRVFFDYYPHSVPYAGGLRHSVLGLGEPSRDRWPEVAEWISGLARTQEVWVVGSWSPCTLEQGVRLKPVDEKSASFPTAHAKAFFPAVPGRMDIHHWVMKAEPLAPGETAGQDRLMTESPIGLRGSWGRVKDTGGGRMARWSRQGSGIIGPMPAPGESVHFQMECAFSEVEPGWNEQIMLIEPPWGGERGIVPVQAGWQTVDFTMTRPEYEEESAGTGTYMLKAETPYNPAKYGIMGYGNDLGVQIRRIIIQIEPNPSSVPD